MSSQRVLNHRKWHRELKAWLEEQFGYEHCEYCGTTEKPIDIAHRKKRYDIHTREEYFMAAMLCRAHHNWVEHNEDGEEDAHARMFRLVTEIIEER